MKKLKTSIGIISAFVLLLNGVVCLDIPTEFLSGSLITEASALADGGQTEEETEEKVFIPASPKLATGAKIYTNRNGYEVFHGYKYSDIPGNKHLEMVRERMVKRNAKRRYTGGASNFRTTNFRKETYASDMKASARSVAKPAPSRKSLQDRKEIGYTRDIQPKKTRIQRYSLRHSLRERGVAESFKVAKEQKNKRKEMHSALWAQNRVPREEVELQSERARIDVKQSDSRKELLEYYEQKRIEEEAFKKSIQLELYGEPEETEAVEEVEAW
jgi:hypothetical protein